MSDLTYLEALELGAVAISDACVSCGKCFEACPMTTPAEFDGFDPAEVTNGIRDMLKGGEGDAAARRWTEVCTNSGSCIRACEYGINPRFMVNLASLLHRDKVSASENRQVATREFRDMSRGIHVLSRLQLSPCELARVSPGYNASLRGRAPDVLF